MNNSERVSHFDRHLVKINTVLAQHEAQARTASIYTTIHRLLNTRQSALSGNESVESSDLDFEKIVYNSLYAHCSDRRGPGEAAMTLQAFLALGIIDRSDPVPSERLLREFIKQANRLSETPDQPLLSIPEEAENSYMTTAQHLLSHILDFIDTCNDSYIKATLQGLLRDTYKKYATQIINGKQLGNLAWVRKTSKKARTLAVEADARKQEIEPRVHSAKERGYESGFCFDTRTIRFTHPRKKQEK